MQTITYGDLAAFVKQCSLLMKENKDYLIALDASMGDGDLGLTMTAGFAAAERFMEDNREADLGKVWMKLGMTFAEAVPSTMGTLLASGFLAAGKKAKGKTEFTAADLAAFWLDFAGGIMERGKAKSGERTIVDSILPAARALEAAAVKGLSIEACCETAFEAAQAGLEASRQMLPVFGRAVYYGEKVLGQPDPGAVVGMLLYKALFQTANVYTEI